MKTIFRKWEDGDVIAIFPEIPADVRGFACMSYQHIGQHGACDPRFASFTQPASPEEYADLYKELQAIGYEDIEIVKRYHRSYGERRMHNAQNNL